MQASQDLNNLLISLNDEIKADNNEQILKLAEKILAKTPDDRQIQVIQVIAQIKLQKLSQIENYFKTPPSPKELELSLIYCYWLYKQQKFEQSLKFLQENKLGHQNYNLGLLEAQNLFKLNQFEEATHLYLSLVKQNQRQQDTNDLIVNLLSSACGLNQDFSAFSSLAEQFIVKGDYTRELLFNLSVLYAINHRKDEAKKLLFKFQKIVMGPSDFQRLSVEDKEDMVVSQLELDFCDSLASGSIGAEEIEQQLKFYQENLQFKIKDVNNRAVYNNNILALRGLHKHEHFSDSLKLIDQAINDQLKQSDEQLSQFRLNKVILLLNKGKILEAAKALEEFEQKCGNKASLAENIRFVTLQISTLFQQKQDQEIELVAQQLAQNSQQSSDLSFKLVAFLVQAELNRLNNQQIKTFQYFIKLQHENQSIIDNEVLCSFIFSLMVKDPELMASSGDIVKDIASKTTNMQILQNLGDMYTKQGHEQMAAELFERLLLQAPNSKKIRFKLAELYLYSNPIRADELLQTVEIPNLIEDFNELSKLESDIALSQMKEQREETKKDNSNSPIGQSQKIKKNQKQIRYPQNYNPENPGPAPNAEAQREKWLPKWERKDWKKRGKSIKKTQGSSSIQGNKDNLTVFQTSTGTSQKETSKTNTKPLKQKGGRK